MVKKNTIRRIPSLRARREPVMICDCRRENADKKILYWLPGIFASCGRSLEINYGATLIGKLFCNFKSCYIFGKWQLPTIHYRKFLRFLKWAMIRPTEGCYCASFLCLSKSKFIYKKMILLKGSIYCWLNLGKSKYDQDGKMGYVWIQNIPNCLSFLRGFIAIRGQIPRCIWDGVMAGAARVEHDIILKAIPVAYMIQDVTQDESRLRYAWTQVYL